MVIGRKFYAESDQDWKVDLEELNTSPAGAPLRHNHVQFMDCRESRRQPETGGPCLRAVPREYRKPLVLCSTRSFHNPKALRGRCSCRNTEARNERRLSD